MANLPTPTSDVYIEPGNGSSHQTRTIPLSTSESPESQTAPAEQSRIAARAAIADADGFQGGGVNGEIEIEDDDFVAVDHDDVSDCSWCFRPPMAVKPTKLDELHPFSQILSVSDVDACTEVEGAFPEHERSSREKIIYRLTKCPELSLGILSRPMVPQGEPIPPAQLVAHIIATRTPSLLISDATMGVPEDWRNKSTTLPDGNGAEPLGHQDQGGTIAVHSLAVLPEHQGKGLGKTLMKAYIQRMKDASIAERIALIAHDHLIPFYASLGFENRGPSECTFGGGGWHNMVLEL